MVNRPDQLHLNIPPTLDDALGIEVPDFSEHEIIASDTRATLDTGMTQEQNADYDRRDGHAQDNPHMLRQKVGAVAVTEEPAESKVKTSPKKNRGGLALTSGGDVDGRRLTVRQKRARDRDSIPPGQRVDTRVDAKEWLANMRGVTDTEE